MFRRQLETGPPSAAGLSARPFCVESRIACRRFYYEIEELPPDALANKEKKKNQKSAPCPYPPPRGPFGAR